jgi:mono/diheme cytochrome c family protein
MSSLFQDGSSARTPVPGTIARGELREDAHFYPGMTADGELASTLPVPLSRELLARGQERFDIYCSVCHGRTGNGLGMIVRRGFKQPSSFHIDRLREVPIAYFFDVMTNGFGVMSSYASQVEPADRWAIAAYIRTLQLSQNARLAELPEAVRRDFNESLEDAARAAAGAATAGTEQGHH